MFKADPASVGVIEPVAQAILTASSGLSGDAPVDLNVIPLTIATDQFALMVGIVRPEATGSVRVESASASVPPVIDLNLFGDEHDLAVCRAGVRLARELAGTAPLAAFLGLELAPGGETDADDDLDAMILAAPSLYYHASCTCRMGPADDPSAVVDAYGRLRAIDGVWVIDASIFPDIPSTPTNMTTMMLAERCSAVLREEL